MALMAKKIPSKKTNENRDPKWVAKLVRYHHRMIEQFEKLCERNATDFTTEARQAMRERLEREGLWPPTAGDSD